MTPPVLTLTLNPAIDQTVTVAHLRPGAVNRASAVHNNAGGKGINVASCLADWGMRPLAAGVLGAGNAAPFQALFADKGIADHFLRRPGDTRTNIKVVEADGTTTDINLPGLSLDPATLDEVRRELAAHVVPGALVVLAGSLPTGAGDTLYADWLADLNAAGARVVLDASNAPLAAALARPATSLPYCVKPNRHELQAWAGRDLSAPGDLLAAGRDLAARGVGLVVISLGEDGALFITRDHALHAALPVARPPSTVGAGDAMVAGLVAGLAAEGDGGGDTPAALERVARLATAFAVGKLRRIGPHLPDAAIVRDLAADVTVTAAERWAGSGAS